MEDEDVNYSLISAVSEGRLERAKELINSIRMSYPLSWSKGYVLLCKALKKNHAEVAKLLLTSGSKVNSKNKRANTPLHLAVKNGNIEVVQMILERGANVNAKNQYGKTPLHNAVKSKNIEVTELLLKHKADINVRDADGTSPLHIAAEIGCFHTTELLLNYGANVNYMCTSACWKKRYTPLHIAVENGNKEVAKLLLSRGANAVAKVRNGVTPLHISAEKGYIRISEDLLNHGASLDSLTLKEGYSPLHIAVELGNEEAVKVLLNRGGGVNALTKDNLTPLGIATKAGHSPPVVRLLLEHGAKVDTQDGHGKTILHLAVEKGSLMIVEDILRYCPDINNQSNRSSLKIAVYGFGEEYKMIVDALLGYGFTVNSEDANDSKLLHVAIEKGYLKIVEKLLQYGSDVNTSLNSAEKDFTPLHTAAKYKQEEVAKLLISNGANINALDETGKTPIFYAIESASLNITELLLTNRAKINDPEILNTAVKNVSKEIVEALLHFNANVNAIDDFGITALHLTTEKKDADINIQAEITKLLLSKGANVNAKLRNGNTALHRATRHGHNVVAKLLLEYGAEVDAREECCAKVNTREKYGLTPLHLGAVGGYQKIIEILLKFGANVNSCDKSGRTALYIASLEGHADVVATLLEYGADVNVTLRDSHDTPLSKLMVGISSILTTLENLDSSGSSDESDTSSSSSSSFECINNPFDVAAIVQWKKDDLRKQERKLRLTVEVLIRHIVKMKHENLYVCKKNLHLMNSYEIFGFNEKCEEEIASLKSEKFNNSNISFYDILVKDTNSLGNYLRNENILQVLKSDDYKTKFPAYASLIESKFRKSMERKELHEQGYKIFHFLFSKFPKLPQYCTEMVFSYLDDKDLLILLDACKPLCISNIYFTNIKDVKKK